MTKTSLRKQIIVFGIIATLIVSGLLYLMLYLTIRGGFDKLEDTVVDRTILRVANGLENNFDYLIAKSGDWAHWDQTYQFIDDLNQAYVDENMTNDAFAILDINLAFYIDSEGNLKYSRTMDTFSMEPIALSKDLTDQLLLASQKIPQDISSSMTGIISTKDELPLLFVAQHILKSDGTGPSKGVLIFAHFLDEKVIERLTRSTIFNIEFKQLNDNLQEDFSLAWKSIEEGNLMYYILRRKNELAGYAVLNDFWGKPSIIFRVEVPREISNQGNLTIDLVLYAVIAAGLIYCLAGYIFIKNIVLRRLNFLYGQVKDLSRNRSINSKEIIKGNDEIAFLAEKMNALLLKLTTAQATLEKSEKRYKGIVETQQDMVIRLDAKANFLYVNNVFSRMVHLPADQLIGKNFLSNLPEGDRPEFEKVFKKLGKKPHRAYIEHRVVIRNMIHWIGWEFFAVTDDRGNVAEIQGDGRDISRLKEIDQLKSEFVSLASHQLRTPLSSIKWFAELLGEKNIGNLNEQQRDCLNQIIESNDRMIKLVNDLLNISHIESANKFNIKKEAASPVKILRGIIKEQTPLAKAKGLNIVFDNKFPEKQLVNLDAEKVTEVIHNLLSNAIKYSYNGNDIVITLEKKHNKMEFSVKNTGAGIDINQRRHIFEKFFRTESARLINTQGSGLGLYIAKAIVERHGGKIWFKSNKKFTTFSFSLPIK